MEITCCLPDAILLSFVILLRLCQAVAQWPLAMAQVTMALLGKPNGGWRTIGMTAMLDRMRVTMRRPIVKSLGA